MCQAPCRPFVTVSYVTARFRKSKWSPWMGKVVTQGHAELSSIGCSDRKPHAHRTLVSSGVSLKHAE